MSFHIIVQDINDEEYIFYNAPIRPCGAKNSKTCTELVIPSNMSSSLTGKLIT